MSVRVLRLPALVALVASLAACGDDTGGAGGGGEGGGDATTSTSTGDTTSSTGGSGGGDATTTTGAGAGSACDFPEDNPSAAAPTAVDEVAGIVLTTDGDPVAESEVQVCGRDICLYGETNDAGEFVVAHDGTELDKPILKAGDGLDVAKFGFALPAEGESATATVPVLVDGGTVLETGAAAEADGVTLTVADDGVVALNLLDFSDPGEDTFRAAVVPLDLTDTIAPDEGFEMIVGLGPHETRFCPPASLSIPNDAALEPGTAVELVLYGLQVGENFVPYGEWSPIATGTVSEDGSVITTDDGEGIPVLGPVGVRVVN